MSAKLNEDSYCTTKYLAKLEKMCDAGTGLFYYTEVLITLIKRFCAERSRHLL